MKLTYFDMHGGRGECARLAMVIGGVDFDDDRLPFARFRELREQMPFFRVPVLEDGGKTLTQSNAINRYVGKLTGLYPDDPWQAALCDETMDAVEDVSHATVATFPIKDEEEKKAARQKLIEFPMSVYLKRLSERLVGRGGSYFADDRLTVADLKVFVWIRGLENGLLDYIPTDVVARYGPALSTHKARIAERDDIKAYYASFESKLT